MIVRPATANDIRGITRVHKEGWRAGYADLFPPEVLARAIEKHCTRWPRVFASDDFAETTMLVAEQDGSILGFAHLGPGEHDAGRFEDSEPGRAELYSFYVDPSYWGSGIAGELLKSVLAELQTQGHREVFLSTYAGVSRARAFYTKSGFHETGRTSVYDFEDVPVPEVEYSRTI